MSGKDIIQGIATLFIPFTAFIALSALAGWLAQEAVTLGKGSGLFGFLLAMLVAVPLKFFSLFAMIYTGIIAAFFVGTMPDWPAGFNEVAPLSAYFQYVWPLIAISLILGVLSFREPPPLLVPLFAFFFPSPEARQNGRPPTAVDRDQAQQDADAKKAEAERTRKAAELDELLTELERTEHQLKKRK